MAQTFTQRLQQQTVSGGGKVTIHHDAAIDELVNGKPEPVPQKPKSTPSQQNRKQPATENREQAAAAESNKPKNEETPDTLLTEPQRTKKVMGYRIQVFAGGKTRADRQKAEQTAAALKAQFPEHKVYVHFFSPRWICRMGNFPSLAEAREVLNDVVRMGYDTATLVRGKVTVPY